MFSKLGVFVGLPTATTAGSAVPAFLGGLIFSTLITKPAISAIVPVELVRLHATFTERLLLTAPLTLGVALLAFLFFYKIVEEWFSLILLAGAILGFTTWLGKTLAFGLAADFTVRTGRFVVEGSRLVWQSDPLAQTANMLSSDFRTRIFGLLFNYYKLYGPELFLLSIGCGIILGWYWSWQLRDRFY